MLQRTSNLWRGGLPPLGRAAALKPASALYQAHRIHQLYDCCAAERGGAAFRQAPSPQGAARSSLAHRTHPIQGREGGVFGRQQEVAHVRRIQHVGANPGVQRCKQTFLTQPLGLHVTP
jgi:hypothetical protein